MYCKQCGKELVKGALFCAECGAKVEQESVDDKVTNVSEDAPKTEEAGQAESQIVQVQAPSKVEDNYFDNILNVLKGFFSNKTIQTVQSAGKKSNLEWLIYMCVSVLAGSLAIAINAKSLMRELVSGLAVGITGSVSSALQNDVLGSIANPLVNSVGKSMTDALFSFPVWFFGGLLICAGTYFVVSSLLYCGMKMLKVQCSMVRIFNMVAVATIPMTIAFVLNIILGFVWLPLIIVPFSVGIIASIILMYSGIQKLGKLEKSPYWVYILMMSGVVLAVVIMVVIVISIATAGMSSKMMGLMSDLGSFF